MRKVLAINSSLCVGCRMCEMACSLHKSGDTFSPNIARIRPIRDEEGRKDYPVVCRHCKTPPCLKACPVKAEEKPIVKDAETGIVWLFSNKGCIGCYECVKACPFGAIYIDTEDGTVLKCDLCEGDPECVRWCPNGAITYSETRKLSERKYVKG